MKIIDHINQLAANRKKFFFMTDFLMQNPILIEEKDFNQHSFFFKTDLKEKKPEQISEKKQLEFKKDPISFSQYKTAFDKIQENLQNGNTYLLNLTFPTPLVTNYNLFDFYCHSQAKYKLLWEDKFCVFSPEIFIKIKNNKIFSYPMKGTIDANIKDAEEILLKDNKESKEHNTIVDLIRNDLSYFARNVHVSRFKYTDRIETNNKALLQLSSEIKGDLNPDYRSRLGEIIFSMLPAGSVSGAPKKKTVEIIRDTEIYERGYYTGIAGYFDGTDFDSFVLIRFIEKSEQGLIYKSGGGITINSIAEKEYQELVDKVYFPI